MPDSVGHHCHFIPQSTKTLQLKKALNFNMQKITSQNYICTLLNFLKPRTLIPSKHCIVFFANREKKYFRKILSKQGRRTPGRRLPFTGNECQSVQWKGWYSLYAWIPNFSLYTSTAWLNSLLNKVTPDTCDLHNHTSPKLLKIERVQAAHNNHWGLKRLGSLIQPYLS